jgi:hypothetical protein
VKEQVVFASYFEHSFNLPVGISSVDCWYISSPMKDRLGDQRGGSEWEPIKILLLRENSA